MNYIEIIASMLVCLNLAGATDMTQGGCSCAVFADSTSKVPLIEHTLPLNVSCDHEGSDKCLQLCIALAEGAKERAPTLICEKLNRHAENLKVSLYTKACKTENWTFTGLEFNDGICCHEGKETSCPSRSSQ